MTKKLRLENARTAGKAASVRADEKRKRYPPDRHPHAELVPFVVEARGRLGEEVLPFLKQHAPAEEPLRSTVLARALRDIAVITQHGLAALLLARARRLARRASRAEGRRRVFAPFSNLNFFVKNRQNFFAIELMNIH